MKNTDMPAIPVSIDMAYHAQEKPGIIGSGLTKREYFAGLAMQALLSDSSNAEQRGYDVSLTQLAQDAVAQADDLLAELDKTK